MLRLGLYKLHFCFAGWKQVLLVRAPRRRLEGWKKKKGLTPSWCVLFSFYCYFSNRPSPLEWHQAPVSSLYFHIQRISLTAALTNTNAQGPALPPQRYGSQQCRDPLQPSRI